MFLIPTYREVPEARDGKEKDKDSEEDISGTSNPLPFYVYAHH